VNIYLSASWKQRERVRALAQRLRRQGHHVYDFTDPACRNAPEIPPEAYPDAFDPDIHDYGRYLNRPVWNQAVECNRQALDWCDAVLLLLPCGLDAQADWAYAVGLGKLTCVVGKPLEGERHPTHLWADLIVATDAEAETWANTRPTAAAARAAEA
jgi:hypothetical protein